MFAHQIVEAVQDRLRGDPELSEVVGDRVCGPRAADRTPMPRLIVSCEPRPTGTAGDALLGYEVQIVAEAPLAPSGSDRAGEVPTALFSAVDARVHALLEGWAPEIDGATAYPMRRLDASAPEGSLGDDASYAGSLYYVVVAR